MLKSKTQAPMQQRAGLVDENGRPLMSGKLKAEQPPAKRQALSTLTNVGPAVPTDAAKKPAGLRAALGIAARIGGSKAIAQPAHHATATATAAVAARPAHGHRTTSSIVSSAMVQPMAAMDIDTSAPAIFPFVQPSALATISKLPPGVEDIDEFDFEDPQFCSEYVSDIFDYLREKEKTDRVDPNYMIRQPDLSDRMRQILVDWIIEVNLKFKLLTETVFLSVNILDKVLANRTVPRAKLQLVGIASMLIASKVEEIFAVEVGDFVYISDNAFTREEVLQCEREALDATKFILTSPSPLHFLRRFSKAAKNDSVAHTLGKYIIEMTLLDSTMLKYLPSQIAAGAVYLSKRILNKAPYWSPTLTHYTNYTEAEALTVARDLNEMMKRVLRGQLKALYKKYSSTKLLSVARYAPVDVL